MPTALAAFPPRLRQLPISLLRWGLAFLAITGLSVSASAAPRVVPMESRLWSTTASPATFEREEGFPDGKMTLPDGYAILKDQELGDGTIEFDMKALEFSDTGILFRRRDAESAEFFYLRADPDCPAANDCYQYAPITHGRMQWDIYPEYQGPAAISEKGWNHIRLVFAGARLEVYLNRAPTPTLIVARLQGLTKNGGIAFKGPAIFANLTIDSTSPRISSEATLSAIAKRPGIVTHWLVSQPTRLPSSGTPSASDANNLVWHQESTEPNGLLNLSRIEGPTPDPAIAWLKTDVVASAAGTRQVDIGFARQAWIFVNGVLAYQGRNPYYPAAQRLEVDGRLETANASVPLALGQGKNEILVAVGNLWQTHDGHEKASPYGWGALLRFENPVGLKY
jgi:hypothetical protein